MAPKTQGVNREEPESEAIPVTGPVSAVANAVQKLSRIPTDKLLVLFVCFGFSFLLYEDKRTGAEQSAIQMRTFEDSRESDRRFHEQQRQKDRDFYARERDLDRATLFSLGQKLEAIERAVRGKEEEALAPMPKLKGDALGGGVRGVPLGGGGGSP